MRLRIFAGPNGSGKSTLFKNFKKKYDPGLFVNADDMERELREAGTLDLSPFGIEITTKVLEAYKSKNSLFASALKLSPELRLTIAQNAIRLERGETNSYLAAFLAALLRHLVISARTPFSFETVMSHVSKLDEIREAKKVGYRCYLYFVCLESPEINEGRVASRVVHGGHSVPRDKIIERYSRALELLPQAIALCDRSFLFDNSGKNYVRFAEFEQGKLIQSLPDQIPRWARARMPGED